MAKRSIQRQMLCVGAATAMGACSTVTARSLDAPERDASTTVSDAAVDAFADATALDGSTGLAILVYSKTNGFRHDSIPAALEMLSAEGAARNWNLVETEDPDVFSASLPSARVVVFALTSGNDILSADQKSAFEAWVAQGNGFVGIHSATDTEYEWPFYHSLVGATFLKHPPGLYDAAVDVTDASHPATASLPNPWFRTDEWYTFASNPVEAGTLDILLTLDESSFNEDPSYSMTPHPISWAQTFEGTRSFYTAMGHTPESYSDPTFVAYLTAAIEWTAQR